MYGPAPAVDGVAVESVTAARLHHGAAGRAGPLQTDPAAVARVAALSELTVELAQLRLAAVFVAAADGHAGVGRAHDGRHERGQQAAERQSTHREHTHTGADTGPGWTRRRNRCRRAERR